MDDTRFNTKGRRCTHFFGEPCPGCGIFNDKGEVGCPEWQNTIYTPDDGSAPTVGEGCYRLMDIEYITGLTQRVHGAAASIESNRNKVDKLIDTVDEKITQGFSSMAQVLVDAVQMQNKELQLTLFEKIEENNPKLIGNGKIGPL